MGVISLLVSVLASTVSLDQTITNGLSSLGTLTAPPLPKFLENNPLPDGFPWGDRSCTDTNPYTDAPDTGVVRTYDFAISRGVLSPDGYEKRMILVNGQFPGPIIEANWGDTIQVTVHNNLTDNPGGTSIHWHGFLQHQSQWMDGTPGISTITLDICKADMSRVYAVSDRARKIFPIQIPCRTLRDIMVSCTLFRSIC